MKLKSVLLLLVIVCINGESSPILEVKSLLVKNILEGVTDMLKVLKPKHVVKIIFHHKNVLEIFLDGVKYKITKDEEGFKVFKKIIEKGKWIVVEEIVANNVLHAASASLPCILSDKEKKQFFKDNNLTFFNFNKSMCQPTEDVINFNTSEDSNKSKVYTIEKLDLSSFK